MVEDRREKILLKALELYMVEGYANVSITDLQAALNMGISLHHIQLQCLQQYFFSTIFYHK